MTGKPYFWWTGPFWIIDEFNETFLLGTLAGDIMPKWVNGFRLKPYLVHTQPNPFIGKQHDWDPPTVGEMEDVEVYSPQFW